MSRLWDFVGFTYNGHHSSEFGLYRCTSGDRYEEDWSLEPNDKTLEVPGGDGKYYFGSTYKERSFELDVAFDNIPEDGIRRIKQWLYGEEIHDLIFDERPYVKYRCKVQKNFQVKHLCFGRDRRYKGEGTISFIAYFPYGLLVSDKIEDYIKTSNMDWVALSHEAPVVWESDFLPTGVKRPPKLTDYYTFSSQSNLFYPQEGQVLLEIKVQSGGNLEEIKGTLTTIGNFYDSKYATVIEKEDKYNIYYPLERLPALQSIGSVHYGIKLKYSDGISNIKITRNKNPQKNEQRTAAIQKQDQTFSVKYKPTEEFKFLYFEIDKINYNDISFTFESSLVEGTTELASYHDFVIRLKNGEGKQYVSVHPDQWNYLSLKNTSTARVTVRINSSEATNFPEWFYSSGIEYLNSHNVNEITYGIGYDGQSKTEYGLSNIKSIPSSTPSVQGIYAAANVYNIGDTNVFPKITLYKDWTNSKVLDTKAWEVEVRLYEGLKEDGIMESVQGLTTTVKSPIGYFKIGQKEDDFQTKYKKVIGGNRGVITIDGEKQIITFTYKQIIDNQYQDKTIVIPAAFLKLEGDYFTIPPRTQCFIQWYAKTAPKLKTKNSNEVEGVKVDNTLSITPNLRLTNQLALVGISGEHKNLSSNEIIKILDNTNAQAGAYGQGSDFLYFTTFTKDEISKGFNGAIDNAKHINQYYDKENGIFDLSIKEYSSFKPFFEPYADNNGYWDKNSDKFDEVAARKNYNSLKETFGLSFILHCTSFNSYLKLLSDKNNYPYWYVSLFEKQYTNLNEIYEDYHSVVSKQHNFFEFVKVYYFAKKTDDLKNEIKSQYLTKITTFLNVVKGAKETDDTTKDSYYYNIIKQNLETNAGIDFTKDGYDNTFVEKVANGTITYYSIVGSNFRIKRLALFDMFNIYQIQNLVSPSEALNTSKIGPQVAPEEFTGGVRYHFELKEEYKNKTYKFLFYDDKTFGAGTPVSYYTLIPEEDNISMKVEIPTYYI